MARLLKWLGVAVVAVLALATVAVLLITNTDRGREWVRGMIEDQVNAAIEGTFELERVGGNLLVRPELHGVRIEDSEGRPFLEAESVALGLSIAGLLRERIVITSLDLVNARVVLDEPPGEEWNFTRIFAPDPEPDPDPDEGWGSWVELRDVRPAGVDLVIRTEWQPEREPADRGEQARRAAADELAEAVEAVPGGYQSVQEFRGLEGRIDRILAAHPDTADVLVDVTGLSLTARPFGAPEFEVRHLAGFVRIGEEDLAFRGLELETPDAELRADVLLDFRGPATRVDAPRVELRTPEGALDARADLTVGEVLGVRDLHVRMDRIETRLPQRFLPDVELPVHGWISGTIEAAPATLDEDRPSEPFRIDARLEFEGEPGDRSMIALEGVIDPAPDLDRVRLAGAELRLEPLDLALVQNFAPDLPTRGRLEGRVSLDGQLPGPLAFDLDIAHRDPDAGLSRIVGRGGVDTTDELRFVDVRVRADPLRLAALRLEDVPVSPGAVVLGTVRLDGAPAGLLSVEADLGIDDPPNGVSRVVADGSIDLSDRPRFRDLRILADPLQIPSLHAFTGELPLGGALSALVQVDGSTREFAFTTELLHVEGDQRSHVEGDGEVSLHGEGWAYVDLTLHRLSLPTVGRFVPDALLQGDVSGYLHAEGTRRNLLAEAELALPDEGTLSLEGSFDLEEEDEPGFHLRFALGNANVAAVTARIDEATSLEGSAEIQGRGLDPRTAEGRIVADFRDEEPADERALHVAAGVAGGLLTVDSLEVAIDPAWARARGTFGLTADRVGELDFDVDIESLEVLQPFLDPGEGVAGPRPAVRRAAVERHESELEKAMRDGAVELLATGEAPDLPAAEDPVALDGLERSVLTGAVQAEGTVRGNPERFELRSTVHLDEVMAGGHRVREGRADVWLSAGPNGTMDVRTEVAVHALYAAGFAYDSVFATVDLRDADELTTADARLAMFQDDETSLMSEGSFQLSPEGWQVGLDRVSLQLGDHHYELRAPARVEGRDDRLVVSDLVLESDLGARIAASGAMARDEPGALDVQVEALEIGHVLRLLQERQGLRGTLALDAPVRGTLERPRFEGLLTARDLAVDDEPLPDFEARIRYEDMELTVNAEAIDLDDTMLTLDATLPVDLGIDAAAEERLRPGPIHVDAVLDEFRLETVAGFMEQLENVSGSVAGRLTVRGTFEDPDLEGSLELFAPTVRVAPLGLPLRDVAGAFELSGRTLRVDSLTAQSRGPVRVAGELDMARLDEPGFDLTVEARNAWIMDTNDVRLRIDADLTLRGPFEALTAEGSVRTREGVIRVPATRDLAVRGPVDLQDPETFERVDQALRDARDELIQPAPLLENLEVDLLLTIPRDVWIRSTELNVEISTPSEIGPLHIRMNGVRPEALRLEGTIQTERGEYEFMGRRFNIVRGTMFFAGGTELDPVIRLTAQREVQLPGREALDIRIIVDGTLEELQTEFESTAQPPLPQTDLLSLVVFGREAGTLLQQPGSAFGGQGGAGGPLVGALAGRATQQFATVALEVLVEELEAEVARALDLDVLHIQPTETPAEIFTGRARDVLMGTEVQAGRYVTNRLFVSGQARPTLVHPGARMEYRMDEGYVWSAVWRPRFLPAVPTLALDTPRRASVLGVFLIREWRF